MCLATPGRIVRITSTDPALPVAEVDFGSLTRPAQLLYLPDAHVGDYVIVQAGFAIRKVSAAEAEESLRYAREMAALDSAATRPTAPPGQLGVR